MKVTVDKVFHMSLTGLIGAMAGNTLAFAGSLLINSWAQLAFSATMLALTCLMTYGLVAKRRQDDNNDEMHRTTMEHAETQKQIADQMLKQLQLQIQNEFGPVSPARH